jgi:hypothetical protein
MNYEVKRVGKCIECQQDVISYLGTYEGIMQDEAINKAIAEWIYDRFGQAGALQSNDIITEEKFLNAKFIASEVK